MTLFLFRPFLTLVAALMLACPAGAQVRVRLGPQLGLNLSHMAYTPAGQASIPTRMRAGLVAGVQAVVSRGPWAVQPALLYSQTGFTLKEETTSNVNGYYNWFSRQEEYRFNYLTLPLNVAYLQHPDGHGFQLFAGPYLSLLVSGNFSYFRSYSYRTPSSAGGGSDHAAGPVEAYADPQPQPAMPVTSFYSRRFDAGGQAGVGYGYGRGLLRMSYSLGLRNLGQDQQGGNPYRPYTMPAPTYHNGFLQVALSLLVFVPHG